MFPCELYEISKNTFSHRTPPVAASGLLSARLCFILGDSANGTESQQDQGNFCCICAHYLFCSSKKHKVRKIKSDKRFIHHCIGYFENRSEAYLEKQSHPKVFCKKGVLENFAKFTGKHLCQSLFFNKVSGLAQSMLLLKKAIKNIHCMLLALIHVLSPRKYQSLQVSFFLPVAFIHWQCFYNFRY